jgi:hypothetical protein
MIKSYNDPIYNTTVTFIFSDNLKELLNWIKKNMNAADAKDAAEKLENSDAFVMRYQGRFTNNRYVIFITTNDISAAILSHEILHLIHFMFDELEIPLSMDTKEVYGYQMQYWMTKILSFIKLQ